MGEKAHAEAEAESEARQSAADANLYFIAFADINGFVIELDGRRDKPVVRGSVSAFGGDFLAAAVAAIRRHYLDISPDKLRFNMMALCGGAGATSSGGYQDAAPALSAASEESVQQLMAFGFDETAARTALEAMGGNVE